jgi:hypothetical protein
LFSDRSSGGDRDSDGEAAAVPLLSVELRLLCKVGCTVALRFLVLPSTAPKCTTLCRTRLRCTPLVCSALRSKAQLQRAVLHCNVLRSSAPHRAAQHCTAHCIAHCSEQHCIVPHGSKLECTALCCASLHSDVLHRTARHGTARHHIHRPLCRAVPFCIARPAVCCRALCLGGGRVHRRDLQPDLAGSDPTLGWRRYTVNHKVWSTRPLKTLR